MSHLHCLHKSTARMMFVVDRSRAILVRAPAADVSNTRFNLHAVFPSADPDCPDISLFHDHFSNHEYDVNLHDRLSLRKQPLLLE